MQQKNKNGRMTGSVVSMKFRSFLFFLLPPFAVLLTSPQAAPIFAIRLPNQSYIVQGAESVLMVIPTFVAGYPAGQQPAHLPVGG